MGPNRRSFGPFGGSYWQAASARQSGAQPDERLRVTLGQGSQTPSCRFCGASLIFRGQTSCQSCGRDLSGRGEPGQPVPLPSPVGPAGPAAASAVVVGAGPDAAAMSPDTTPAPAAPFPAPEAPAAVRLFESARMPPPTPLPPSVRLSDATAPTSTAAPTAPTITPADAASSTAGDAPASTVAPLMGAAGDAGWQGFEPVPLPQPAPRRSGGTPRGPSRPPLPPGAPPDTRWPNKGYRAGRERDRNGYSSARGGSGCNSCTSLIGMGLLAIALIAFVCERIA